MKIKKYLLPNRYGDKNYLVITGNKKHGYIEFDPNSSGTIRGILDENKDKDNPYAIDPSGGPFIAVGSKLFDMTISRIYWDGKWYLEFE